VQTRLALSAMKLLCIQPSIFEVFVIRMVTRLELLCSDSEVPNNEASAAYAHSILVTIYQIMFAKIEDGHSDVAKYFDRLGRRLFDLLIHPTLVTNLERLSVAFSTRIIDIVGLIIMLLVEAIDLQYVEPGSICVDSRQSTGGNSSFLNLYSPHSY
jgi:DNA repair/transcription protein MET18/MMS19